MFLLSVTVYILRRGIFPLNVVPVNDRRAEEVSVIKAKYPVSYADAFCIELAEDMGVPVITGDSEFGSVRDIIKVIPI